LPACTGIGLAIFVTERSAEAATNTLLDALLLPELGSTVDDEATESVCVILEPEVAAALTFTTNVKVAVETESVGMVQVNVPQVHPAGPVSETAVVLAGRLSVKVTVLALAGPALVTVCA
jgi:hypothetical protein